MITKLDLPFYDNSEEDPSDLRGVLEIDSSCGERYTQPIITIVCKDENKNIVASVCLNHHDFLQLYYHLDSLFKLDKETREDVLKELSE